MKIKLGFIATILLANFLLSANAQTSFNGVKQTAQLITASVINKQINDLSYDSHVSSNVNAAAKEISATGVASQLRANANTYLPMSANMTARINMIKTDTLINGTDTVYRFNTTTIAPQDFVAYALTLKGTPYVYGSVDPAVGLDCSGLVTHIFNHFNIAVPRRTVDFKNAEKKISIDEAKPGDIVLFTGSDLSLRKPGHMGIITAVGKDIEFVHASSGQTCAVTMGKLSYSYFKTRLLDIVRVF